jgi:2'-5' RNA ligase
MFYMVMSDNASVSAGVSRLFLAVVPDAATAARMYRLAGILKRAYQFSGKPIEPDRLHVSLLFLGGLPDHVIGALGEAVADVRMPPFEVSFDRSVSFLGKAESRPFVLIGDEGTSGLMSLRQKLGVTLTRAGLRRRANAPFTPHVTLLYDPRRVDEHPIEPIAWTVGEFVLIHSMNGHTRLARWPLRA